MKNKKFKSIIGWIGIILTIFISSLWAYWGSIENFHEGWYAESIWENLFMFFFQYILITIVFVVLAIVSLKWKLIGAICHVALAGFCLWFFSGASFSVLGLLIIFPIIILGLLYFFGEPTQKKWGNRAILIIPTLIILAISVPQFIKISNRYDDGNLGMRVVEGNGITLTWAPRGPGWPDSGTTWEEAMEICKYLSEDGLTLMEEEQNIWRLPTIDEAVRSMMLHGENVQGEWDSETKIAHYSDTPDKESPLWDVHSQVIYYWTSDVSSSQTDRAYIIVYHGGVFLKMKIDGQAYLSFRAVK
ncbi:MAG: DUF1566 domain-containing protein [Bacilli bacterium]